MNEAEHQVVAFFQFDTEGHVDSAGVEHRQFTNYPKVATFAQQRHSISLLHAERLQSGTDTIHLFLDLSVSRRLEFLFSLFQQKSIVGILLHRRFEKVYNCLFHKIIY